MDAAIRVLAEQGSRGLTHGRVDRSAEVPDGTTSYYYRTREALLRGVGRRVAEIDVAHLQSVADQPANPDAPFAHLAALTLEQASGDGLALNRARHELLLGAARDPALADTARKFAARINAMARDAIVRLQPDTTEPALRDAQAMAVTTFLAGVLTRLATGDPSIHDAERLARLLTAIATAVALTDDGTTAS